MICNLIRESWKETEGLCCEFRADGFDHRVFVLMASPRIPYIDSLLHPQPDFRRCVQSTSQTVSHVNGDRTAFLQQLVDCPARNANPFGKLCLTHANLGHHNLAQKCTGMCRSSLSSIDHYF